MHGKLVLGQFVVVVELGIGESRAVSIFYAFRPGVVVSLDNAARRTWRAREEGKEVPLNFSFGLGV